MSLVKFIEGEYKDIYALPNVLGYCGNKSILWDGLGVCTYNVNTVIDSMKVIKKIYNKEDGKMLYHFMVSICRDYDDEYFYEKNHKGSFEKGNCDMIATSLCEMIYNMGFQNAFFIHGDSTCYHIHFVINSVSYVNGNRLTNLYGFTNSIEYYLKCNYRELNWLEY